MTSSKVSGSFNTPDGTQVTYEGQSWWKGWIVRFYVHPASIWRGDIPSWSVYQRDNFDGQPYIDMNDYIRDLKNGLKTIPVEGK